MTTTQSWRILAGKKKENGRELVFIEKGGEVSRRCVSWLGDFLLKKREREVGNFENYNLITTITMNLRLNNFQIETRQGRVAFIVREVGR